MPHSHEERAGIVILLLLGSSSHVSRTVETSSRVIPAVAITGAADGTVDLATLARISVREAEVLPIVELFRESVSRLAAVVLPEAVVESTGPPPECLRIELDGVTGGVFSRTQGIRADGRPLDDERYRIVVEDEGVLVQAPAGEGVHRALTSLVQLAALGNGVLPRATIDDCPGLSWRGLSIDVVRTFVPVDELKRVIDMLSLYKLNVLHVHLTDNEGWRLQIRAWPRLTEVGGVGAWGDRSGGYDTQGEFRELVDYAAS
ncbi:MAG: family 20 glycosylhydrolase, partial [Ilumatobacteraceae bacterium]